MIIHLLTPTEDAYFCGPACIRIYVSIPRDALEEDVHLQLMLSLFCRANARSNGSFFLLRLFPEFLSGPDRPCPVSGLHRYVV